MEIVKPLLENADFAQVNVQQEIQDIEQGNVLPPHLATAVPVHVEPPVVQPILCHFVETNQELCLNILVLSLFKKKDLDIFWLY